MPRKMTRSTVAVENKIEQPVVAPSAPAHDEQGAAPQEEQPAFDPSLYSKEGLNLGTWGAVATAYEKRFGQRPDETMLVGSLAVQQVILPMQVSELALEFSRLIIEGWQDG